MKISFFRLGHTYIPFKGLCEKAGLDVVVPPIPSKKTLEFGIKHAPEYSCFPFKMLLGTYKEAIDLGADTILTSLSSGLGSCQFSEFNHTHEKILRKQGYDVTFLNLRPGNINFVLNTLQIKKRLVPELLALFIRKSMLVELAHEKYDELLVYAKKEKNAKAFLDKAIKKIDKTQDITGLVKLKSKLLTKAEKIKRKDIEPLRIGLTGDIYTILESSVNNYVIERLAKLGAHVFVPYKVTEWIKASLHLAKNNRKYILNMSKPYLTWIGGFANQTITDTIEYSKHCNGVVHLYPFTCMPEMVAKTILPKVGKDFNIPLLHLPIDEQTGEAGMQTRLEAFIDLLKLK